MRIKLPKFTTQMDCKKCGQPMKSEAIWVENFCGGSLVPAFSCNCEKKKHRKKKESK